MLFNCSNRGHRHAHAADHILLGTDYPYDMGEEDPVGLLQRVDGLSDDEFTAIRGQNASNLLNL